MGEKVIVRGWRPREKIEPKKKKISLKADLGQHWEKISNSNFQKDANSLTYAQ